MDGYAVVAADTTGATREAPRRLRLAGRVFTGDMPTVAVTAGACVEVATGAPMPAGADAVIMVEETTIDGADIVVFGAVHPRQNIGPQGADISTGQTVLEAGEVLNASRIGALAALGFADVEVWAQPTVAILSTGNEIAEQGAPLAPGQIYDINRFPRRSPPRATRSRPWTRRSTRACSTTSSCSRAAARWVSAISSSTSSGGAARSAFTASP
jgi:molybdopterin molybdotransferase